MQEKLSIDFGSTALLFNKKEYSDCKIVCNTFGVQHVIHLHRAIVCTKSAYLKKKFEENGNIMIVNEDHALLLCLLRALYTNELEFEKTKYGALCALAKRFHMPWPEQKIGYEAIPKELDQNNNKTLSPKKSTVLGKEQFHYIFADRSALPNDLRNLTPEKLAAAVIYVGEGNRARIKSHMNKLSSSSPSRSFLYPRVRALWRIQKSVLYCVVPHNDKDKDNKTEATHIETILLKYLIDEANRVFVVSAKFAADASKTKFIMNKRLSYTLPEEKEDKYVELAQKQIKRLCDSIASAQISTELDYSVFSMIELRPLQVDDEETIPRAKSLAKTGNSQLNTEQLKIEQSAVFSEEQDHNSILGRFASLSLCQDRIQPTTVVTQSKTNITRPTEANTMMRIREPGIHAPKNSRPIIPDDFKEILFGYRVFVANASAKDIQVELVDDIPFAVSQKNNKVFVHCWDSNDANSVLKKLQGKYEAKILNISFNSPNCRKVHTNGEDVYSIYKYFKSLNCGTIRHITVEVDSYVKIEYSSAGAFEKLKKKNCKFVLITSTEQR